MTSVKHINNISEHFIELENRINNVRFARIEASKRLRKKGIVYNTIISFYSILITVLAIVFSTVELSEINPNEALGTLSNYQKDSLIILALSSFITMLTLFFSNRSYSERSAKYQSNYMELTRLLADIQNLIVYYKLQNYNDFLIFKAIWESNHIGKDLEKRLAKKYKIFADKYAALLTQSENHEDIDYKKACLDEITDEIKNLEKINFKNYSFQNEVIDIASKSNGDFILNYNKNTFNFNTPRDEYCPPTAELKSLYKKQSDLQQEIFNSKILDTIKFIFIFSLPLLLLYILNIFRGVLEILR